MIQYLQYRALVSRLPSNLTRITPDIHPKKDKNLVPDRQLLQTMIAIAGQPFVALLTYITKLESSDITKRKKQHVLNSGKN